MECGEVIRGPLGEGEEGMRVEMVLLKTVVRVCSSGDMVVLVVLVEELGRSGRYQGNGMEWIEVGDDGA